MHSYVPLLLANIGASLDPSVNRISRSCTQPNSFFRALLLANLRRIDQMTATNMGTLKLKTSDAGSQLRNNHTMKTDNAVEMSNHGPKEPCGRHSSSPRRRMQKAVPQIRQTIAKIRCKSLYFPWQSIGLSEVNNRLQRLSREFRLQTKDHPEGFFGGPNRRCHECSLVHLCLQLSQAPGRWLRLVFAALFLEDNRTSTFHSRSENGFLIA